MKTIEVELNAFYGYGCGCGSYDSNDVIELEIEDSLAELLKELQNKGVSLDQEGIPQCIEKSDEYSLTPEQKTLLDNLHDKISDEHKHMVDKYWVFEADNECEREAMEPAMEEDIKNGIYEHSLTFEEFMAGAEDDYEDEEDAQEAYEDQLYEDYRDWVYSHDEDTELQFIADRIGCELSCDDTPVEYEIKL